MLGAYTDFSPQSAQVAWLKADLAAFSRARTPWLIATFHATWYNTYEVMPPALLCALCVKQVLQHFHHAAGSK